MLFHFSTQRQTFLRRFRDAIFSHFFGCVPEETLADTTQQFFRQIQDFTYQSIVTTD